MLVAITTNTNMKFLNNVLASAVSSDSQAAGVGEKSSESWNRDFQQLLRLQLVQSTTIDAPLADQVLGRNLIEHGPNAFDQRGILIECLGQGSCRVHHQIDIGRSGLGAIEDEAKRPFARRVAAAKIGADDGGGRALFLRVP